MVRWDSPLFTVPWTDESPPNEGIWKAITEGLVKPPNVGTQSVGRRLGIVVPQLSFISGTEGALRHAPHPRAHRNGDSLDYYGAPVR